MLWLLDEHHVLPGRYYQMAEGEKALIRLMFNRIMDARNS